jgi:hypothetical protein
LRISDGSVEHGKVDADGPTRTALECQLAGGPLRYQEVTVRLRQVNDCQDAGGQEGLYGEAFGACLLAAGCIDRKVVLILRRLQAQVRLV